MRAKRFLRVAAIPIGCATAFAATAADWMQFGYDAAHSGSNPAEISLSAANVDQIQERYAAPLPASVDGAPVYLSDVQTSDGTKDLLFLLAKNGTLMAIDAADGSVVWSHQESGQQPTTSSPAIDPSRDFVYAYGLDGYVHKYRVGDGAEMTGAGWPEQVTQKTDVEKVAGSLTIGASGDTYYLYVVTDGYIGDAGDYQGHIVSIDLSTGAQNVFNVMCSDNTTLLDHDGNNCDRPLPSDFGGSGIWGRGGATFYSGTDRVYVSTGNGWFDADTMGFNWGDSVLSLVPSGVPSSGGGLPDDSYTPDNFLQLFNQDTDLGSVSLAILPSPAPHASRHLGVQLGKDAQIRLIDLDNMSGSNLVGVTGGELQLLAIPQGGGGTKEQPAVWVDGSGKTWLLIANNSGVSGLDLTYNNNTPVLTSRWSHDEVSQAKSAIVANGVLYYAAACSGGYCMNAVDPSTGDVLWTSSEHLATLHWQSPILVDGAIYIADGSTLHRFDAGIPVDDTVFRNGFDP